MICHNLKIKSSAGEQKNKTANLTLFNNVVVIDVGIKPSQHFPKLKDDLGNKIKDENGKDKRSEVSDGYTYLSLNLQLKKWLNCSSRGAQI